MVRLAMNWLSTQPSLSQGIKGVVVSVRYSCAVHADAIACCTWTPTIQLTNVLFALRS
jgi:hypothetical protein